MRTDIKLSKGKTAAQAAHASIEAYKKSQSEDREEWESTGSKKVVLKVKDIKGLLAIQKDAREASMPFALIKDAGKTEVKPGTVTALGIGPCDEEEIDRITGHLKIL